MGGFSKKEVFNSPKFSRGRVKRSQFLGKGEPLLQHGHCFEKVQGAQPDISLVKGMRGYQSPESCLWRKERCLKSQVSPLVGGGRYDIGISRVIFRYEGRGTQPPLPLSQGRDRASGP